MKTPASEEAWNQRIGHHNWEKAWTLKTLYAPPPRPNPTPSIAAPHTHSRKTWTVAQQHMYLTRMSNDRKSRASVPHVLTTSDSTGDVYTSSLTLY